MTLKICDLSWTKPLPSLLVAAGIKAACLYVSQDVTGKNMNAPYVRSLAGAGLWTVTNFEYAASQMLGGYAQGVTDARLGLAQARACGMPAGRPIYYSADFDATAAQMTDSVIPYLQGARSVTGPGTVGFYGGYPQVLAVLGFWAQHYPGERVFIWQSPAWSGGRWSASADIRQQVAQETIGGGPIDIDYAYTADFGQWMPGVVPVTDPPKPPQEAEMILVTGMATPDPNAVWALLGSLYWHVADGESVSGYKAAGALEATITPAEHQNILAAVAKAQTPLTLTGSVPLTLSATGDVTVGAA